MVEEARKAGVTLGLVHNYLFQPEIILARELITSGALGQVEVVIINYLGVYDYPGNAAYGPTWRHDLARSGGGIFMDIIHLAYLAEALLDRRVERVSAYANARTIGAGVEDVVSTRFETADNAADHQCRLELRSGWHRRAGRYRGERHRRSAGDRVRERRHVLALPRVPAHGSGGHPGGRTHGEGAPGDRTARGPELRRCDRRRRAPAAPGEDGQRTLEGVMAAYESAALGRTVGLPLDPSDPLYLGGAVGLRELEMPDWSPVRRKGIFGVAAT